MEGKTRELIEHLAELAKLHLDEKEKDELTVEISKIMAYFDKLKRLDISGIEATEYLNILNINGPLSEKDLRADVVSESYEREKLLTRPEERETGYYIVPGVLE